jgi:eukaryotic-like serine/threonine-protein kinase
VPAIGQTIAERYRLEEELGSGNVGWVFRATHLTLASDVAIKILKRHIATEPRSRARFEREALLAAKLRSDHVVRVIDHGVHEELPFMVMEHLQGEDLRQRLRARRRLALSETIAVVSQVCRGLSAAHQLGLVHRDIKPENVFIRSGDDGEERVVVLDFGVAKVTDAIALDGFDPTQTGTVIGTPYYLSPEQARGDKALGPAADLWSLAVVAFECLTGERPFNAPAMGPLIAKILYGAIPSPSQVLPSIPEAVDAWFRRALVREPERRFESARAMASAMAAAAGVSAPSSRPLPYAAPTLEGRGATPELWLWRGQALEQSFAVAGDTRIGRGAECEISIAHHTLSREHALVGRGDGGLTVRDLGSKNGTYLNEKRVGEAQTMLPGDKLRCGGLTFELSMRSPLYDVDTIPPANVTLRTEANDPWHALPDAVSVAASRRSALQRSDAILALVESTLAATQVALVDRQDDRWRVVQTRATQTFDELPEWLDDREAFARGGWMGAPIRAGAQTYGVLVLRRDGAPDAALVSALQAFADVLALSLARG